jgi:hypothetical protein
MAKVADAYVAKHPDPESEGRLVPTWEAALSVNLMGYRNGTKVALTELERRAKIADKYVAETKDSAKKRKGKTRKVAATCCRTQRTAHTAHSLYRALKSLKHSIEKCAVVRCVRCSA